jgi:hypothetical protein
MTKCKRRCEGEGAYSPFFANRSHLSLRGKLGWMTPRVGVKTTLTMERASRSSRSQAGAALFLLHDLKPESPVFPRQVEYITPLIGRHALNQT